MVCGVSCVFSLLLLLFFYSGCLHFLFSKERMKYWSQVEREIRRIGERRTVMIRIYFLKKVSITKEKFIMLYYFPCFVQDEPVFVIQVIGEIDTQHNL